MTSDWISSVQHADFADWVTVVAYLVVAHLCSKAARSAASEEKAGERNFWRLTAVLLTLFGINELLDLQTLLTSLGRAHAKANGWYGQHRSVQYAFLVALGVAVFLAGAIIVRLTRAAHTMVRMAVLGLSSIGVFILVRAASFHHLDELLGSGPQWFNWGSVQELAGILIVGAAAAIYHYRFNRPTYPKQQ